jgi:hypothetical protein
MRPAGFDDLWSDDAVTQHAAFQATNVATREPVDWAYDVWDELLARLSDRNNRCRAIAAQTLSNLAKSDPERRILTDLPALVAVTRDERFVTARHTMQSLWKVGVAGDAQRAALVDALVARFAECSAEKNCTLIRYDILEVLRKAYDVVGDESLREVAQRLIETEDDPKYRKKYAGLWKAGK